MSMSARTKPAGNGTSVTELEVHVVVTGDASNAEDHNVPGTYGHAVRLLRPIDLAKLSPAQKSEIAELVLDEFHERQGIECLDDFIIEVRLVDGAVLEQLDEDLDDFDLVANVDHHGKIEGPVTVQGRERRG